MRVVVSTLATSWLWYVLHACVFCAPTPVRAGDFLESSADFVLDAKIQTEQMERLGSQVRSLSPRLSAGGTVARRFLVLAFVVVACA